MVTVHNRAHAMSLIHQHLQVFDIFCLENAGSLQHCAHQQESGLFKPQSAYMLLGAWMLRVLRAYSRS